MNTGPELAAAMKEAGVIVAYLFGSRARDDDRADSDVDVAVLTNGTLGLFERARLAGRLADALGAPSCDLVLLAEAPLEIRGRVLLEGHTIYCVDEARRVAFEVRTRSEWFDFQPPHDEQTRSYIRRVAQRGFGG